MITLEYQNINLNYYSYGLRYTFFGIYTISENIITIYSTVGIYDSFSFRITGNKLTLSNVYERHTFTRKFEQNIMETELDIRKKKEKKEWVNRINRFGENKPDLLYRYEPYYIYEGWNYTEKYTPKIK